MRWWGVLVVQMTRAPLVSIIIATMNSARYLAEALDSVRAQTYTRCEIVLVDSHSTDDTLEIATAVPHLRPVTQTGQGLSDAWNCGIDAARGELIAFLDSDDRWTADKLERQVAALAEQPEFQYVDGKVKFFLDAGQPIPAGFRPELLQTEQVGYMPGTILARKSLFESLGNFKPELAIAGDIDWFARAKDRRVSMSVVPAVVLYKRVHASNLSLRASGALQFQRELLSTLRASVARQHKPPTA